MRKNKSQAASSSFCLIVVPHYRFVIIFTEPEMKAKQGDPIQVLPWLDSWSDIVLFSEVNLGFRNLTTLYYLSDSWMEKIHLVTCICNPETFHTSWK